MNLTARFLLAWAAAIVFPVGAALAGPRAGFSRPAASHGGSFARPSFRSSAPAFRQGHYGWSGNRSFNNFSPVTSANRFGTTGNGAFVSNRAVVNRINDRSRLAANWNRPNRLGGGSLSNRTSFNRGSFNANLGRGAFNRGTFNGGLNWRNGWRWRHRHDCDSFVFFSGFGFPFFYPFFYPWDWGYYPTAYYPAYPYSPSYYDPTIYSPGYPGYQLYGDGGYSDAPGYDDDSGYRDVPQSSGGDGDQSVIARVQEILARKGYYKGPIDGVAGSRTYYAIRAYQRDHKLPPTGRVNNALLEELGAR